MTGVMILQRLARFAASLAAAGAAAFACAWFACAPIIDALETRFLQQMSDRIAARGEVQRDLFEDAASLNADARAAFMHRYESLDLQTAEAEFDALFPLQEDGTRRSHPDLWDGMSWDNGDTVHGVGAFLAEGAGMDRETKRVFLAGFHAVRTVGEGRLGQFDNLYFFNGDRRAILFAPQREDRLEFYRFEAPADFNLRGDEDPELLDPELNPDGRMICTRLSRYLYQDGGERFGSACRQPVDMPDGRRVGAFGSSIQMNPWLADAVANAPRHGVNVVFDRDGVVIARTDAGGSAYGGRAMEFNSFAIRERILSDGRDSGVIIEGRYAVGFAALPGADWIFTQVVSRAPIQAEARAAAAGIGWRVFAMLALAAFLFELGAAAWTFRRARIDEDGGAEVSLAMRVRSA